MGYKDDKANPLSLQEADAALYGSKVELPASGRVVAKPIQIEKVWPDVTQPRRAIPAGMRGDWMGSPLEVGGVIGRWRMEALAPLGQGVTEKDFIRANDKAAGVDASTLPALTADYLELLSLAGDIHRHGLENPIAVIEDGGRYVIESGERRWVAHHILTRAGFSGFDKIPARIQPVSGKVWRQASENGIRKPLNAIGLARQLALLIMDMYEGDDGVSFDDYETLVLPGECDRKFYAQVANGNIWRIKKGFSQRILDATGLKSRHQISQYRNLLSIDDELWMQADAENWTENHIRTLTAVNVSGSDEGEDAPEMGQTRGFAAGESGRQFATVESPRPAAMGSNRPPGGTVVVMRDGARMTIPADERLPRDEVIGFGGSLPSSASPATETARDVIAGSRLTPAAVDGVVFGSLSEIAFVTTVFKIDANGNLQATRNDAEPGERVQFVRAWRHANFMYAEITRADGSDGLIRVEAFLRGLVAQDTAREAAQEAIFGADDDGVGVGVEAAQRRPESARAAVGGGLSRRPYLEDDPQLKATLAALIAWMAPGMGASACRWLLMASPAELAERVEKDGREAIYQDFKEASEAIIAAVTLAGNASTEFLERVFAEAEKNLNE